MGSSDLKEAGGNVCFGISDFSDDVEANAFKKDITTWCGRVVEVEGQGAMMGVFEYKTRHKDIYGGLKNIPKTPTCSSYLYNSS